MSEWSWLFSAGIFLLALAAAYGAWAVGRYKGESAHALAKEAKDAADAADRRAVALAATIAADLAAYKAEVVGKFATIEMLQKSEDRVADAINRLADRLDRILEQPRPAPRTRVTKG
jgi:hypothetical protein